MTSDEESGDFVQARRTKPSRIRMACFPNLCSFAIISGLCSICTDQLNRLSYFCSLPIRRWSIWRGCRSMEEVLDCKVSHRFWLAVEMTHPWERLALFGRACLFFPVIEQPEVVFFLSLETLEWHGAFLQIHIGQDSSFLILRFSCSVSL